MPRYIDADDLLSRMPDDLPYKSSVKRVLTQAPTADVVEVVRCRKCKSSEYTRMCSFGEVYCTWHGCFMHGEGFCNDGEREEN